ncbi:MAG: STAS domain-containing protein [Ramlibacter sp.]|nr:STAS domain-containing protein [Ramlibacter sp.]
MPVTSQLDLQFARLPQAAVITLLGRLDGNSASEFGTFVATHLQPDDTAVVLDCKGLSYVSSAGLREFLKLAKQLHKHQARPAIASATPAVFEALEIAGFHSLFHCKDDLDSALKAVAAPAAKPGLLGQLFGRT